MDGSASSPAVANGVVYVGSDDGKLEAFDANGVSGCSGNPKTCIPLWTASAGSEVRSSPAVANGVVYVGSADGRLYAFDADGVSGCSGSPKVCTPLWSALTGEEITSSPSVANGVVFVGSGDRHVYAFDAAGVKRCSGDPKECSPLWSAATPDVVSFSSPAVAGGMVYIGSLDALQAFALLATTASIQVSKDLVPATDPGRFDLRVGSTVVKAAAGNGDSGSTEVPPGTYTVSEVASAGSLANYDSSISCDLDGTPGPSGSGTSLDVTVAAGDQLTCTITNQRKPTITVTKHLVPANDAGRFNLQIDGVTYAANAGNNGTTGSITVATGSHTVRETAGTNTVLDGNHYVSQISCTDGSSAHGTSLNVTVTYGDAVTCTITNTRKLYRP
jgi:outer membrane protein assembly factor BamB